ncbi:MAG TPA: hypothetical protein DHD79_08880 [Firmicutes bacterium]|jgi:hypothetical protein|nr:hypothetical protein [Bacillota bacterium]HAW69676.1 hypothetical protein [Bacillota bacterium]HBE06299.1 hypothetical protein [Bacillota bacterium]HBR22976.1 hypothetical protein [Bacillota bacterium]HCF88783.1 hypothetical protein [Bacillota bacterium]
MTRREKTVVTVCLILAVIILLARFAGPEALRKVSGTITQWPEIEQQWAEQANAITEAATGDRRSAAADAKLSELQDAFFGDQIAAKSPMTLLRTLEELARAAGISVISKDIIGTDQYQGLVRASVSLSVDCQVEGLARMLYSIGHAEKYMTIEGLEVADGGEADARVLRCRMLVSAVFPLAEAEAVGAGGANP